MSATELFDGVVEVADDELYFFEHILFVLDLGLAHISANSIALSKALLPTPWIL